MPTVISRSKSHFRTQYSTTIYNFLPIWRILADFSKRLIFGNTKYYANISVYSECERKKKSILKLLFLNHKYEKTDGGKIYY